MLFTVHFSSAMIGPFPFSLRELRADFATGPRLLPQRLSVSGISELRTRARAIVLDDYIRQVKVKAKGAWPLCLLFGWVAPPLVRGAFEVDDTISHTKSLFEPGQVDRIPMYREYSLGMIAHESSVRR